MHHLSDRHHVTELSPPPSKALKVRQMAGLMVTVSGLALLMFNGSAIL